MNNPQNEGKILTKKQKKNKRRNGKQISPLKEERMNYLFSISSLMTQFHPVTGQHCGLSIRNLAHKYVSRISKTWKRKYCTKCWMPLTYSSFKTQLINGKYFIVTHCCWCHHRRLFYLPEDPNE
ncbi:hypothetical protein ENUP19_0161G0004 [Entamoeba nuttalli]|uniref:RNAse P Rpr2/Rpp21 subunit domain containing protein n=1 Tax=Entamoeba nuttalli TaxID=412467 RepID=A0ABQ0DLQ1_9EUKA